MVSEALTYGDCHSLGDRFVPGGQHGTLSPKAKVVPQGAVAFSGADLSMTARRTHTKIRESGKKIGETRNFPVSKIKLLILEHFGYQKGGKK